MSRQKLVIVDGSSLLSTAFYGTCPREYYSAKTPEQKEASFNKLLKTSKGVYTNAVYPMLKTLFSLISKQKPDLCCVCWDVTRSTFRREIYADYKGQRKETPNPLKQQFSLMQNVLREMGFPQFMNENYEADDFIGSLAKRFEDEAQVFIITKDQDALQLVSENTRVWLITSTAEDKYKQVGLNVKDLSIPQGCFEFTPLYVKEFYGLEPIQIIDMKALEGDSSDNIPGVYG